LFYFANAQEVSVDLPYNGVLINRAEKSTLKHLKSVKENLVQLPFIDDFSYYSIYPDSMLWQDSYVFYQ